MKMTDRGWDVVPASAIRLIAEPVCDAGFERDHD